MTLSETTCFGLTFSTTSTETYIKAIKVYITIQIFLSLSQLSDTVGNVQLKKNFK